MGIVFPGKQLTASHQLRSSCDLYSANFSPYVFCFHSRFFLSSRSPGLCERGGVLVPATGRDAFVTYCWSGTFQSFFSCIFVRFSTWCSKINFWSVNFDTLQWPVNGTQGPNATRIFPFLCVSRLPCRMARSYMAARKQEVCFCLATFCHTNILSKMISQLSELWSGGFANICTNICSSNSHIRGKGFWCLQSPK